MITLICSRCGEFYTVTEEEIMDIEMTICPHCRFELIDIFRDEFYGKN